MIEELLAVEPDARPASAAEVLDRLDEVLPGTSAVSKVALAGVLASKAFAGRESERGRLRALLKRALSHMGGSAVLLGPRGVGRTRLLAELAVEARVAGAHVIQLTGDGERVALSAAVRALLKLFETLPSAARAAAAPYASVLGHLSEEVRALLEVSPEALERFPEIAGEGRMRIQGALHSFWLKLSHDKPLVLLLDDLPSMDDASVALFTTLARDAGQAQLLVVAGVRSEHEATVPPSAQAFVEKASVLALGGLLQDECEELLRSIFGETEHLSRTAQYLSDRAEGNPGRLMELCEYLVHSEKIRCLDGVWLLPQELSELAIPASLAQLDEARLARVGGDARALVCALSVMERAVPLELCSLLSPLPPVRMFSALDELCAAGVLIQGENGHVFRSETLRSSLASQFDQAQRERAHVTAGEALLTIEQPSLIQRMEAGVHLLEGGSSQRGAEVMQRALIDVLGSRPEEHAAIAYYTEQAFTHVRKLHLHDAEKLPFLGILAWAGYFVDRRYGFIYGEEALLCAQRVCGMTLARRLSPWLGKKLGLYVALLWAAVVLRKRAKKSALVPDFAEAMLLLMTVSGCLSGMYALCVARDKVRVAAEAIEPLTALSPDQAPSVVYQFGLGCVSTISDRPHETRQHWARLLSRLDDPRPIKGLDAGLRDYYTAAILYGAGGTEYWCDKSRALEIADRLEHQPLKLYQLSADQIRAQYYAHQGNMAESALHKARVEMRALQRGMTWQVEIMAPTVAVTVATRQRDAMALKRAAGQLSRLSVDTPSLRSSLDYARASYCLLRGRPAQAVELLEPLMRQQDPEQIGHANAVGLLAQAYNALNRFADAERVAGAAWASCAPRTWRIQA